MSENDILTPEDDLFGRVALHNKLVTLNQIVNCARTIATELVAGRPRHSLASLLISRGYLSAQAAAAVEKAVQAGAAKRAGTAAPAAGLPPQPKRMKKPAPAGDSQVLVPVEPEKKRGKRKLPEDDRFRVEAPKRSRSAILVIDCHNLYPSDAPAFEAACRRLLETDRKKLTLDLRKVRHVPSVIIGELGKAAAEARAAERELVILGSEDTAKVVRLVHGDLLEVRLS